MAFAALLERLHYRVFNTGTPLVFYETGDLRRVSPLVFDELVQGERPLLCRLSSSNAEHVERAFFFRKGQV
jgi:hypothetical protein